MFCFMNNQNLIQHLGQEGLKLDYACSLDLCVSIHQNISHTMFVLVQPLNSYRFLCVSFINIFLGPTQGLFSAVAIMLFISPWEVVLMASSEVRHQQVTLPCRFIDCSLGHSYFYILYLPTLTNKTLDDMQTIISPPQTTSTSGTVWRTMVSMLLYRSWRRLTTAGHVSCHYICVWVVHAVLMYCVFFYENHCGISVLTVVLLFLHTE